MTSDADRSVTRVDTTAAWPDRWSQEEPENPDAAVVRARSLVARGWEVRGSGWGSTVGDNAFAEFHRVLRLALAVTDDASRLAQHDPTPWVQRLLILIALGAARDDFERTWAEVIARDPLHREAHNFRLMYLCQKWHGSHEEMFGFARAAAAAAPDGSPLLVLPVQANAEWALWVADRKGGLKDFIHLTGVWRGDPSFHADLDAALKRWFARPMRKHAMWYHDLNYLAYGLVRANRFADAKPVFEAIGPYLEDLPWGWWETADPVKMFLALRSKALRR